MLQALERTIHGARQVKHQASLVPRRARALTTRTRQRAFGALGDQLGQGRISEGLRQSVVKRYLGRTPGWSGEAQHVTPQIFAFWTGKNPMSDNRARCLEAMRVVQQGVDVILVTPDNLHEWIVGDHPLHPAYERLAYVHRADYLRCYFMHHHGGGYADIKTPRESWESVFDRLNTNPGLLGLGFAEKSVEGVAQPGGLLEVALQLNYSRLVSNCGYIFRSGTPFTAEWLRRTEAKLTSVALQLPVNDGDIWGHGPGYPLRWTELLGEIFHPCNLAWLDWIGTDPRLELNTDTTTYR